jgi:glycogen(starch) synthase
MTRRAIHRVLMTGDTVGGVWTFALELASALRHHGVEVVFATMGGMPAPRQMAEAAAIPNLRLIPSAFKLEWMDDPWDDVERSREWLLDIEKRVRPDVIHLNSYGHGTLSWNAPVVLTAHSCVLSWWSAVKQEPLPASWQRYRAEVGQALTSVDVVTAPTQAMLNTVYENYGAGLPPARVIPNGRSADRFRPAAKEPFIFAAGRLWDEAKNVLALEAVAPRLSWPVYVAGDTAHPNGTAASFQACRALGHLDCDSLADWYARASVYALPARYEPFGLSALEAAMSGCALVLGDIPSLREVWGDAAVFVPHDDPEQLCRALSDTAGAGEMSRRAAARAREFTPTRMAAAYMDAYQCAS